MPATRRGAKCSNENTETEGGANVKTRPKPRTRKKVEKQNEPVSNIVELSPFEESSPTSKDGYSVITETTNENGGISSHIRGEQDSQKHQQDVVNNFKEYIPDENHLLEVRTHAGNTFKNLLDTLKAVLNDANIIFTENGLKLASVDSNKHALVHLFMEASSFEFFHCKQRLVLGIDIEIFHRTIKTNKLNDMMCFIVRRDNPGFLEVSFENYLKGTKVSDTIELLSLKEYNIKDKIEYKIPPEMDSQSFQNICREMASFQANFLEIKSIGDNLIFSNLDGTTKRQVEVRVGNPDEVTQTNVNNLNNLNSNARWQRNMGSSSSQSKSEDARGIFLLKFLKSFAKAASLSPRVRIYLKNDSPLICEYSVAGLGTLKYVLSCEDEEEVMAELEKKGVKRREIQENA